MQKMELGSRCSLCYPVGRSTLCCLIVWIYGHSTVAGFTPDHEAK